MIGARERDERHSTTTALFALWTYITNLLLLRLPSANGRSLKRPANTSFIAATPYNNKQTNKHKMEQNKQKMEASCL